MQIKGSSFLIYLIGKNKLMPTIEKVMQSYIDLRYMGDILSLHKIKNSLLERQRLFRLKVRDISHNVIVSLFPCYSETIFSHINFLGGYP